MYYYGVICNEFDKGLTDIEGDHNYKPRVEFAGISGSCHWFNTESLRNEFIAYAMNELHYHYRNY